MKTDVASSTQSALLTVGAEQKVQVGNQSVKLEGVLEDGKQFNQIIALDDLKKISIDGTSYDLDQDDEVAGNTDYVAKIVDPAGAATNVLEIHTKKTTGTVVASIDLSTEGVLFNFKKDQDGNVKELQFFNVNASPEGTFVSTATLEAGDTYLNGKKLLANTVVFNAKDGYNQTTGVRGDIDEDDVTTTTWGQYTGSDINKSEFIYNDDNEIVAVMIKTTTTSDVEYKEVVVQNVLRNTDNEITSITAYVDGVSKTIKVDDVVDNYIAKGDVAVLKFSDGNLELAKDVVLIQEAIADTTTFGTLPYVIQGNVASTGVDVGERTVTIGATPYKLVSDGAVIDATNKNDIKVKALSDLRGVNNVTVIRDEKDSTFVKYFVIGGQEFAAPSVTTAYGSNTNAGGETIADNGNATIVFSEALSAAGKSAVESAITTAATLNSNTIAYTWTGATLVVSESNTAVNAAQTITFTGDVTATATDVAGNSATVTVIND